MRGQPPKLTGERRQHLLDLLADGWSMSACARELKVSRTTLYNTRDRDPLFAQDLAATRLRAAGRPVCPTCCAGELAFIAGQHRPGIACRACATQYLLAAA